MGDQERFDGGGWCWGWAYPLNGIGVGGRKRSRPEAQREKTEEEEIPSLNTSLKHVGEAQKPCLPCWISTKDVLGRRRYKQSCA